VSVAEALDRASQFDDLDALVEEMDDDAEEFAGLEGGGSFETVEDDESEPESGPATGADPEAETGSPEADPTGVPSDPQSAFAEMKAEVERSEPSELDAELDDVEFGEFDEDDDMTVGELITGEPEPAAMDPTAPEAETANPFEFGEDREQPARVAEGEPTSGPESDPDLTPDPDPEPEREPEPDTASTADGGGSGPDTATGSEPDPDSVPDDPGAAFAEMQAEIERADPAELSEELEAVQFGEFDDEDQLSVRELIAGETGDPGREPADSAEPETGATEGPTEPTEPATPKATGDTGASGGPRPDDEGEDQGATGALSEVLSAMDRAAADEGRPSEPGAGAGASAGAGTAAGDPGGEPESAPSEPSGMDVDLPDEPSIGDAGPSVSEDSGFQRDAGVEAFEDRFGGLFGEDSEPSAGRSVPTIAESDLEADRFSYDPDRPDGDRMTDAVGSLTVDVSTAEQLLGLVEELSLARLNIESAVQEGDTTAARRALSELSGVTSQFRQTVTDLRLMPLERATRRLPRVARDAAREAGKQVEFTVEGEDVQLDRSIVDRVGDPLVHLVRNAVDHGIEAPAERERAGKPPEGRVTVRAERTRNRVVVEVEDDGRGIDPAAVRETALEQGLLSGAEAESLGREETYDLLFRPGFTTREEVTAVSGRGVGMDVVGRSVAELDGTVEIDSRPGEGTTVRLRLPVSIAMGETLFVRSGGEEFGLPTGAIDSIERVGVADGGRVRSQRGEPAGREVISLAEAFATPEAAPEDEDVLITIREDVRPVAVRCSGVGEKRETVTTPYEGLLADVPGISGATLTGDGRFVNVIDIETL
jgi:two-component system chemotaxis sensor kinase CheA